MARDIIPYHDLQSMCMTGVENLRDFRCSKPEFEEYLRVDALYDQDAQMGHTYLFVYDRQIVGYVVLAMAHMPAREQKHLDIDTHGTVPALLISHLATHKQYERRGVGRGMILWVIRYARRLSKKMGCRAVLVSSDKDVVGFYEKIGFFHGTARADIPNSMYFDIKNA